jgi:hypothetical protein
MSSFIFTKEQLEWIEALESGKYKQCSDKLYDPETNGFCCLGVACAINGVPITSNYYQRHGGAASLSNTTKTRAVMDKLHLRGELGDSDDDCLASLNDNGKSFEDIAQVLRKMPEQYFSEGAES